ncbi:MAG: aspartate 1-decarboxylase [Clostridia bacterium]
MIMKEFLYSKIYNAKITSTSTGAGVGTTFAGGSITISGELLKAAKLYENQKVIIADINNGNRFETYIVKTDVPKTISIDGAAARLVSVDDKIIIMAFEVIHNRDIPNHRPIVITVNDNNKII